MVAHSQPESLKQSGAVSLPLDLGLAQPWYVAQIKPNGGQIAERNLLRQGYQVFAPKLQRTVRRQDRWQQVLAPLFPGYLFVGVSERCSSWRAINGTLGITRLVSFSRDGAPAPVPAEMIAALTAGCHANDCLQEQNDFKPGDRVGIRNGPFAELVGHIQSLGPDQRAWVLLDILGGKHRIGLSTHNLMVANQSTLNCIN